MVDLTIVSCLAPSLAGGRDVDEAAHLFQPLVDSGVPIVVYVEEQWKRAIRARYGGDQVRLHETSAERRAAAFAMRAELEVARTALARADLPTIECSIAMLTKMGMLHDQSIWNPHGTRHLVWIDADVAVSVYPRYFTDEHLLDVLPCLLQRFFLLMRPSAVPDATGAAAGSRIQGQLFGGELRHIAEVNALYYQTLEQVLSRGELPTEERLLTHLVDQFPERFDRFILQENGLLGTLFEAMRAGRVAIERTTVY